MGNSCSTTEILDLENKIIEMCKKYGIEKENIQITHTNKKGVHIKIKKFFFILNIDFTVDRTPLESIPCSISETILDKTTELGIFKNLETSIDFVAILIKSAS